MERIRLWLLPGMMNTARVWDPIAAELADVADVHIADLSWQTSIAEMARSVLAQQQGSFALAGFSMGGYVAQEIVAQAPSRVSHLALLGTSMRPESPEQTAGRKALLDAVETDFSALTHKLLALNLHPAQGRDSVPAQVLRTMFETLGPDVFARQIRAITSRHDTRAALLAAQMPVAAICGREDRVVPPALSAEIAAQVPGASLTWIEQAGHMAPLEQPSAVASALRKLLRVRGAA
ncbi:MULTISPECIES: alpha/beta fold hydrolase [unclassified Cupriavidus]|uniref:alpha/beta fold hydrolase n=1 Tax=unclassified Cupriavidus TaxID=2640874 RepID=UPI001055408D|nr:MULTISPECIES: alpha/beta fold hydrolase [unclassified Cupriavidus]MBF6989271.1 alpha/beta fold hydrolase [Cupriavidus sp. IK-TO18]TDF67294.1 alpha/beta fold hydrolase [Cupriavidus sp. L7L]